MRIESPFVGGGFGSGLRPQYQTTLAVMAARLLKRSVRLVLTRQQMFTFGHRPQTLQHLQLSADADGTLTSVYHSAVAETSQFEDFVEVVVNWSGMLYACENVTLDYNLVAMDLYTPLDMRAPGAAWGVYALECAMDELAYQINVDPLQLRLENYTAIDPSTEKPFSSKELRACYQQAAERFGWSKRNPAPRSHRDGRHLIGWGMATGIWDSLQMSASAKATLGVDGKLIVGSATSDIGTGTYTVMTQIAADALGIDPGEVTFKLGADAKTIMDGARAEAERRGLEMSIAITDDAGILILLERLDNGRFHTPEIATAKARTSAISRTPTSTLQEQVKTNPAYLTFPGRVPLQGGLPILHEGAVVGAIGVSGGKPEEDEAVCQAGLDALTR